MNKERIVSFLKQNKKVLLILAIGIILILSGNLFSEDSKEKEKNSPDIEKINEKKLCEILENVSGAGKVKIFISYENQGETEYITDNKTNNSSGYQKEEKHIYSDKEPVVKMFRNPEIRGVLVTATGAVNTGVKNRLMRCIRAVTGINYDRISVEAGEK